MAGIKAPKGFRLLAVGERIPAHYQWWCYDEGIWLPGSGADADEFQGNSRMEYPHAVPIESKLRTKAPVVQETSRLALKSQGAKAPSDCAKILARLKRKPTGLTCDELEALIPMSHQTASARIRDLSLRGDIKDSGKRRDTRTGRKAIVWAVVKA